MPIDPTSNDVWMRQICKNCGRARELHRSADAGEKVDQCPSEWGNWSRSKFEPTGQIAP